MPSLLPLDNTIQFPDLTVVSASAGSGKTYTLALRYVQFLLSSTIPNNAMRNILAITFTNNAANEMKQRIIILLKKICLRNNEILEQISFLVALPKEELIHKAELLLGEILDNFSAFQVKTIDSFLISVFKTTALEFGYHPETEIVFDTDTLLSDAIKKFVRTPERAEEQRTLIFNLVKLIEESHKKTSGYIWNPYKNFQKEIQQLYNKFRQQTLPLDNKNYAQELQRIVKEIAQHATTVAALIEKSGLPPNKYFMNDLHSLKEEHVDVVLTHERKEKFFNTPKNKTEIQNEALYGKQIENAAEQMYQRIGEYVETLSRIHFYPYIQFLSVLEKEIEELCKEKKYITLADVNYLMKRNLHTEKIPEVYYKLGETIYHYLIDEFQDTSSIRWYNIKPLLSETLAQNGSLFIVGDTKQSIYGFLGNDWRIMKRVENGDEFDSAAPRSVNLGINFRSMENIVRFNESVFRKILPQTEYAAALKNSGADVFAQDVQDSKKGNGCVRTTFISTNGNELAGKEKLLEILRACIARGYSYQDITIITPNNNDVIRIGVWLNENAVPFLSQSNLDVRNRKITQEIFSLLQFLDAPIDNLSFATFLLSDIFEDALLHKNFPLSKEDIRQFLFSSRSFRKNIQPLYKLFQMQYSLLWECFFENLFTKASYLPLYDSVDAVIKTFSLFERFPKEEATVVKILESVHLASQQGCNSIKDFLQYFSDDKSDDWNIVGASSSNAVQIMTIHKAKGLDFRVVLVLLPDTDISMDKTIFEESNEAVHLLYFENYFKNFSAALDALSQKQLLYQQTDALNKLYVAFTRAEDEMYILIIGNNEQPEGPSKYFSNIEIGTIPSFVQTTEAAAETLASGRWTTTISQRTATEFTPVQKSEMQRGIFFHSVFSYLQFIDENFERNLLRAIAQAKSEIQFTVDDNEIFSIVQQFFAATDFYKYFIVQQFRTALIEQELVHRSGTRYSCDRIIIDENEITVIDFKTVARENEEQYSNQVKNYMNLLREIYPQKKILGLIAYIDAQQIVPVQ